MYLRASRRAVPIEIAEEASRFLSPRLDRAVAPILEGSRASIVHAYEPSSRAMLHLAGVAETEIGR
jgi:hypothetical protein